MRCHWLRLRATAHATEDPDKVRHAMRVVSGLDEEPFAERTEATRVESHHGGHMVFFETTLTRAAEVRRLATALLAHADVAEVPARVDEECVYHLRFEKQAACVGDVQPTRGDDAVQVRMKVEVHPARQEAAIQAVQAAIEAAQGA